MGLGETPYGVREAAERYAKLRTTRKHLYYNVSWKESMVFRTVVLSVTLPAIACLLTACTTSHNDVARQPMCRPALPLGREGHAIIDRLERRDDGQLRVWFRWARDPKPRMTCLQPDGTVVYVPFEPHVSMPHTLAYVGPDFLLVRPDSEFHDLLSESKPGARIFLRAETETVTKGPLWLDPLEVKLLRAKP